VSAQTIIIALLLLAGLYAAIRALLPLRPPASTAVSGSAPRRQPARFVIALLSLVSAALLAVVLFPPTTSRPTGSLLVLTAGSTTQALSKHSGAAHVVALPEAPALAGVERVPDLATALRRHPASRELIVAGIGLPLRDQQAAAGRPLRFDATPLPRGVVEFHAPNEIVAGRRWSLQGRVQGVAQGHAELRDPAGERVDRVPLATDGGFLLQGRARAPGRVDWSLRITDASGKTVEDLALPAEVTAGAPLRMWALSGGPDPELKYLRRWAVDAGLSLRTRISLGAGMAIGDVPSVNAETLREVDLLVLDERAWRGLAAGQRVALRAAVREGLGLLLRITGPLSAADRRELQSLGFSVQDVEMATRVQLPPALLDEAATADAGDGVGDAIEALASRATEPALALMRRPVRVRATDGLPLLTDEKNEPLALWRSEGRGRVGLWWLSDSWRLVLAGQAAAHGQLWSEAAGVLARARPAGRARLLQPAEGRARIHQRAVFCGLSPMASVVGPQGSAQPLRIDPASGVEACAAYWPAHSGWHELRDGEQRFAFHVRGADEAAALQAQALGAATQRLVRDQAAIAIAEHKTPGPRWPWFLAWLSVTALLWWLEQRQRRGAQAARA
jgi:hypothetical protein